MLYVLTTSVPDLFISLPILENPSLIESDKFLYDSADVNSLSEISLTDILDIFFLFFTLKLIIILSVF